MVNATCPKCGAIIKGKAEQPAWIDSITSPQYHEIIENEIKLRDQLEKMKREFHEDLETFRRVGETEHSQLFNLLSPLFNKFIGDKYKTEESDSLSNIRKLKAIYSLNMNELTSILNDSADNPVAKLLPLKYLLAEQNEGTNKWSISDLINCFYGIGTNKRPALRKKIDRASQKYFKAFYTPESSEEKQGLFRIKLEKNRYRIEELTALGKALFQILKESEKIRQLMKDDRFDDAVCAIERCLFE